MTDQRANRINRRADGHRQEWRAGPDDPAGLPADGLGICGGALDEPFGSLAGVLIL